MRFAYTACVDQATWSGVPKLSSESFDGTRTHRIYTEDGGRQRSVCIELHEFADKETGVGQYYLRLKNQIDRPVRLSRADIGIAVEDSPAKLHYYTSYWGDEFTPMTAELSDPFFIEVISGRSNKGYAPWIGLEYEGGFISMNIGWSGNWQAAAGRQEREGLGLFVKMGLSSRDFYLDLAPGEEFVTPEVYISFSAEGLEEACYGMRQYFAKYISLLDKEKLESLPVCYNSWWPFRDILINESRCIDNAKIAGSIGIPNFMLDAGWFGNGLAWEQIRGDWDIENTGKFPHGIQYLGKTINDQGIKFGIWCEIEAAGPEAELNKKRPDLIAKRDGESLGYVCMGNPDTVDWAVGVVDKLVAEYGAHWIKFDFNLDPMSGCNRTDHGHGAGDGLYAHYRGYDRFLEIIHQRYPDLVLEDCSSGGLRMDFGILSRMHFTFLSDPDYVDQHLQTFWGATSFIHPVGCYHFTQSQMLEWDNGKDEVQNPISEQMSRTQFDYYIRSAMMSTVGFSYDLTAWPEWCRQRLKEHVRFFQCISKKYIMCGGMFRLTKQPLHRGGGERCPAFQFTAEDGSAYVFAFKLKGALEDDCQICLKGLKPERLYQVHYIDRGNTFTMSGKDLMEKGVKISGTEESSEVISLN